MFKGEFPVEQQADSNNAESEKTRKEMLEEFKNSLDKYGVEGISVEIENNNLKIEQKYGGGIPGLSKSDSSVWMCLDYENVESFKENDRFNANSNLDLRKKYEGLTFGKNEAGKKTIEIDAGHPVVKFSNLLGKNNEVYLPGDFNKWYAPDPLKFNKDTGGIGGVIEGKTAWNEEKKAQCKPAIHIKSEFDNGGWEDGADQIMTIDLGEENEEE